MGFIFLDIKEHSINDLVNNMSRAAIGHADLRIRTHDASDVEKMDLIIDRYNSIARTLWRKHRFEAHPSSEEGVFDIRLTFENDQLYAPPLNMRGLPTSSPQSSNSGLFDPECDERKMREEFLDSLSDEERGMLFEWDDE